jgi:sirohydrochlorin ferrochelatase
MAFSAAVRRCVYGASAAARSACHTHNTQHARAPRVSALPLGFSHARAQMHTHTRAHMRCANADARASADASTRSSSASAASGLACSSS